MTRLVLIGGVIAFGAFLLYEKSNPPKKPSAPDDRVSGLWWSVSRKAESLELDRSPQKAMLSTIHNGVTEKKEGTWTLVPNSAPPIVEVNLRGPDGNTVLRLQLVDSVSDYFLAPVPFDSALLKDSWIADREVETKEE